MRIGIIGAGTIGRLILEHVRQGAIAGAEVVALAGRSSASRGAKLAAEFGVPFVVGVAALREQRPDVVVEAASHEAVAEYGAALLDNGIATIVLSGGALCDDALRARLEAAARRSGATLHVPSGGIGGLDALKAACVAGVDEVTIAVTKPPVAWKGIAFVDGLGIDLDALREPRVLFEGPARDGVPLFPANVNIAAVLAMAGVGFDRTRLKAVADPALIYNTHFIEIRAKTGNVSVKLENVPSPENPKTAWLACYSALAALRAAADPVRYGT